MASQFTAMSSSSSLSRETSIPCQDDTAIINSDFHGENDFVAVMTETLDEELAQQINEYTAAVANAQTVQEIKAIVSQVKKIVRSHPAFAFPENQKIAKQAIQSACENKQLKEQGLVDLARIYSSNKSQKRNVQELDAQNKKQKRTFSIDA